MTLFQLSVKPPVFFLWIWIFSGAGLTSAQSTDTLLGAVTSASVSARGTTEPQSRLGREIAAATEQAQQLQAVEAESEVAASALEMLTAAGEQLKLRDRFTSETQTHVKAVREAPAQLEVVRSELAEDDVLSTHVEIATTATAEIVEQQLAAARAELRGLQEQLDRVQAEQQRRTARAEEIPRELVQAQQKQAEAAIALQSGPGSDDPLVARARELFSRAQLSAADAQTTALQAEQSRYLAREEVLPLARQLLMQRIDGKQGQIAILEARLAELRRAEASATAQELKKVSRETMTSHPVVQMVASENTSITTMMDLGSIVETTDDALNRLQRMQNRVAETSATFTNLRTKFQSVGYSDALGIVLRRQRKELPSAREHREYLQGLDAKLADVNLQVLETQERVNELSNPDSMAREMVSAAGLDASTTAGRAVRLEVSQLLQARRDYLVKLADGYENLFQAMVELDSTEKTLIQISREFKAFIDERIFWLPSTERISMSTFTSAASAFVDLVKEGFLTAYWKALLERTKAHPVLALMAGMLFVLVLAAHGKWKRALKENLALGMKSRLAAFRPLANSFFYAVLYVMPWPLIMVLLGLPLAGQLYVPVIVAGLGSGLIWGGVMLFAVRISQVLIRMDGVVEVFFSWPEAALVRLRRTFSVFMWVYIPAVVLITTWQSADTDPGMEALRLVLIGLLSVIVFVSFRLFWPTHSVFKGTQIYQEGKLVYRLRYVIFLVLVGGPVVLIVAAIMGYLFTAIELASRLNMSLWIGVALLFISETAFFWILVKRRRLAIDEARRRREASKGAMAVTDGEANAGEMPPVAAEPKLDIAAISNQAGRLLRVLVMGVFILALWGIWAEVLPALNYLDSKALWTVSRTVSETDPATGTVTSVEKLVPVTLVSGLLVCLILAGLVVALKNIPGLLDISVYQRYEVQAGEKYAFNTLIRYLLIIVAVTYVLYLLGLQWKQIQWLLAGVSVGLGFGLQEIFANFVSGLILLFERPIRVGDVVTVGDQSGRVSQIRIRATTVVNWDHRILIIPNKELITKSVLNWTLINAMTRLVMTVRVNHGNDFDRAREIILTAARECAHVLKEPAPSAAIDNMDMNSVDFMLVTHLATGDHSMDAKHEIITRIQRDFKAAGIQLAVPRMDIKLMKVE